MSITTLYDPEKQQVFTFDGVTEITHSLALKTETDSTGLTEGLTQIRQEPDRVTLSVVMSEAHNAPGQNNRIENFLTDLIALKEGKVLCQLHTRLRSYMRMVLTDITVTRDEKNPFGWQGTLTLQEMAEETVTENKTNNTSTQSYSGTSGQKKPVITISVSDLHVL